MKKKMLAAVGISGLLMAGGVLSASATGNGYQLFKDAVKKTQHVNSFTADVQASLTDNGKTVYSVSSVSKENVTDRSGNSIVSVKNGGKTTTVDYYSQNHQTIVKSSNDDNYYVQQGHPQRNGNEKVQKHNGEKLTPQMQTDVEAIFDAVTKNYQNKVDANPLSNGNTQLSFDLNKDQIPAVGQAVVSFFLKNLDQNNGHFSKREFGSLNFADLKPQLPQLKNNIEVTNVSLKGIVDKNGYLTGQEATIEVTGTDVNGKAHDLVLHLTNNFTNINKSTVSSIDLKGKKVVTVQNKFKRHED